MMATALPYLTAEWQTVRELRRAWPDMPLGVVVFEDLVVAGLAEVKREPIVRSGILCGEVTSFRLA